MGTSPSTASSARTAASGTADLPILRPDVPLLPRADHSVHVGTAPESAEVLPVPPSASPAAVIRLLEELRRPVDPAELLPRARSAGLSAAAFTGLVARLTAAGKAVLPRPTAPLSIRVSGFGPLAGRLRRSLDRAGLPVLTEPPTPDLVDGRRRPDCNLLVLADQTLVDPAVRLALMRTAAPHLIVGVDDGVGQIGPLVLPGLSSCLRCLDLYRAERDPQWPLLAALLQQRPAEPEEPAVAATAALAHYEIADIAAALADPLRGAPQTVDHILQVQPRPAGTRLRPAPVHPRCSCRRETPAEIWRAQHRGPKPVPGHVDYPQGKEGDCIERDHTRTGAPQCQAGQPAARHGRARGGRPRQANGRQEQGRGQRRADGQDG